MKKHLTYDILWIERKVPMFPTINKRETGINLRRIMDKHGVSVKELQHYLGLGSEQSIYHWLNGLSMPTIDNLYALSELFQLPMDEIVCGNRSSFATDTDVEFSDSCSRRLLVYYEKLKEMQAA